jgi:hypothetical protein
MSTTFNSNSAEGIFDGETAVLRLNFNNPSTDPVTSTFKQLTVTVIDSTTLDTIEHRQVSLAELKRKVAEAQGGDPSKVVSYIELDDLETSDAKKVKFSARENGSGANDVDMNEVEVTIVQAPSAPSVEIINAAFAKNSAGTGVIFTSGFAKVTPKLNENVSKVQLIAVGTKSDGTNFRYVTSKVSFTPSLQNPFYSFDVAAIASTAGNPLGALKPDAQLKIYATCEAEDYDSLISTHVSAYPSIRLEAVQLDSALSLQDSKITASGTVKSQQLGGTNKYSILAQKKLENASLSPTAWKPTNHMNVSVPSTISAGQTVQYTREVTSVDGTPLESGTVYALTVVQHKDNIDLNKSLDVFASANAPALEQSPPSAVKTAVPVSYYAGDLKMNSQQAFDAIDNRLQFLVEIQTSNGQPATFSTNTDQLVDYSISSTNKGRIGRKTNASGNFIIEQGVLSDRNPLLNDAYTLEFAVSQILSRHAISSIMGNTQASITEHYLTGQSIVQLAKVTLQTKKAKDSSQVSSPENVELRLIDVGNQKKLAIKYETAYDKKVLSLNTVQLQMMKGTAGSTDAAFTALSFSGLTLQTTLTVPKNGNDIQDAIVLNDLYEVGPNNALTPINMSGTVTCRVRNQYTDNDTNASVDSGWTYDNFEVPPTVMSAPMSTFISSVPSDDGKAFAVTIVAKKRADVTGHPYTWPTNETQLVNAKVALYNADGKDIATYTHTYTAAEKEAFATADVFLTVTPPQFTKLQLSSGEYMYAEAKITYGATVAGKFVTSEGSVSDRNAFGSYLTVAPDVEVSQVTLSQNPPLLGVAGDRQVDSGGMVSLTITAKVKLNGLSPTAPGSYVKAFLASSNAVEHILTYQSMEAEFAVYRSASIVPTPSVDYKKSVVVVACAHPGSSNRVAYKALQ